MLRLAYLVTRYPLVSHTFIRDEVEALRARGVDVHTFSNRRTERENLLSEADVQADRTTYALVPPRLRDLLRAHVRVITTRPHAYLATLRLALRLAGKGTRARLWQVFYFGEAVLLRDQCRRRGLRHVHAHHANPASDVALLAAHLSELDGGEDLTWSFTLHGPHELVDPQAHRLSEKARRARFVVCISDYAKTRLAAMLPGEQRGKLEVVHCGVRLDRFAARGDPVLGEQGILTVGRAVQDKGQAVLLQALARLADTVHSPRLVLVGDGPDLAALRRLADELGLEGRVRFTGALAHEHVREHYAQAAVFCLPSFAEGLPVVLMEAMASGVPVVATRIAGVPELIEDDVTGLLVSPGDADELAAALRRLAEAPELARELARAARRKVEAEFDVERSAAELERVFAERLTRARPR